MHFAKIALRESTARFDQLYSYVIPAALHPQLATGQRVLVPFGRSNRLVEGIVIECLTQETAILSSDKKVVELKEIYSIIDETVVLAEDQLQLLKNIVVRYACTWSAALRLFLPSFVRMDLRRRLVLTEQGRNTNWQCFSWPEHIAVNTCQSLQAFIKALNNPRRKIRLEHLEKLFSLKLQRIQFLIDAGYIALEMEYVTGVKAHEETLLSLASEQESRSLLEGSALKSIGQVRVLELLLEYSTISMQECMQICSVTRAVLQNMVRRGWLLCKRVKQEEQNTSENLTTNFPQEESKPNLTQEQEQAFRNLLAALDTPLNAKPAQSGNEHLLFGITGSGKTEVYLRLAEECCARQKGVIMLVPEISLTPQMTQRFQQRFGEVVAVLHSRLTPRQRYFEWQRLLSGKAQIAIGPRSAIFSPVPHLGLIIVDEEQENAYCAETHPRYDARNIARMRSRLASALLLFGSATPSIETYYRTQIGKTELHCLSKRANQAATLPEVHILDMKRLYEQGQFHFLAPTFLQAMERTLKRHEQCMVLLNRRGYAQAYFCADCGAKIDCPNCSVAMTYHQKIDRLVCHYCGQMERLPQHCPSCSGTHLHKTGAGTEQVESRLRELFPAARIARMDQDTTATRFGHSQLLSQFQKGEIDILLGTQMIAKGHDFPNVTFVGILGLESLLNSGDYRAPERCFQLLTQAAGRAGRAAKKGEVYIQAYQSDDYALRFACKQDYLGFYKEELHYRRLLQYPPFTQLLQLSVSGNNENEVETAIRYLVQDVTAFLPQINAEGYRIFAPHRAPIYYMYKRYHWQFYLKCTQVHFLPKLLAFLTQFHFAGDLRLTWQLDPG